MSTATTSDVNHEVLAYYRTLTTALPNSKLSKYFLNKERCIVKSNSLSVNTSCPNCHENEIKFLKVRLLSKRAKKAVRNTQKGDLKKDYNTLSLSCKTCGKTSLSNAIDRTLPPPVFTQIVTPKRSDPQKTEGTPDIANGGSTSKKRPKKSGSKLQQQLQKSRAKQTNQNMNVSLSDFLLL